MSACVTAWAIIDTGVANDSAAANCPAISRGSNAKATTMDSCMSPLVAMSAIELHAMNGGSDGVFGATTGSECRARRAARSAAAANTV